MFQDDARTTQIETAPPLKLAAVFRERRALSFIVVWFVSNGLFGIGAGTLGLSDAPVAWQAHVGGFVAGLLLFPWFDPAQPEPAADSDIALPPPDSVAVPHQE